MSMNALLMNIFSSISIILKAKISHISHKTDWIYIHCTNLCTWFSWECHCNFL